MPIDFDALPRTPEAYAYQTWFETRWADNDIYGHVNNTHYHAFFDSAINRCLIGEGRLDIDSGPVIGVCAENGCRYIASVSYPERVRVGVGVERLGRTSVTYRLGMWGEEGQLAALGHFVHVFVDRQTMRPVDIPDAIRQALERLTPAS